MISSLIWNLRWVPVVGFLVKPHNKKIAWYDQHEKVVQASIKANLALYEYLLKNTEAEDLEWLSETLKPLKASLIADGVVLNEIFPETTRKVKIITTKGDENMDLLSAGAVALTGAGTYAVLDAFGVVDGAKNVAKNVASNALYDLGLTPRNSQRVADNDAISARRARKQVIQDAEESGVTIPERLRSESPEHKERWAIRGYSKETRKKIQELANERLTDMEKINSMLEMKKSEAVWEKEKQLTEEEVEIEAEIAAAKAKLKTKNAQKELELKKLKLEKEQVCNRSSQAVAVSAKRVESVNKVPENSWFGW